MGLIKPVVEAIHGEDDKIAGRAVTRLVDPLLAANDTAMLVESTMGFGEFTDGTGNARLSINGELIDAQSRTVIPGAMQFITLTRGVEGTKIASHPAGSLVFDQSENTSAKDHARRGFLVNYAQAEDLDTIGRNNGLQRCPGLDQETWRRLVRCMSFLPKNTDRAIELVLRAYFDNTSSWEVYRRPQFPYRIYVRIELPAVSASVRGRFILTGGTARQTTGLTTVTTPWPIRTVAGVYLSTVASRRGLRAGLTNYFTSGSFSVGGTSITLGSSPGAIGTAVLVDYTPYDGADATKGYHYLAQDENVVDAADRWAYLSDPTATITCLLNQVRPAGHRVFVSLRS